MTSPSRPTPGVTVGVRTYILGVCLLAGSAFLVGARVGGTPEWSTLLAILALSIPLWWVGEVEVNDHVTLSLGSVVLLAAAVIVGPVGAGLIGLLLAGLTREALPIWPRVFNAAMTATVGVTAGLAYLAAGGVGNPARLAGGADLLREVGGPLLVAELVQAFLNMVLLGGVTRLAQGVPMRLQATRLLRSGPVHVGYGVLAFLLLVLWFPAGLGPWSVVLLLLPLLGAHWTFVQYATQKRAQERSLSVLVSALEQAVPSLTGHSARVADLAGRTAERLALGVEEVRDIRHAALLHDLGLIALPGRIAMVDPDDPEQDPESDAQGRVSLGSCHGGGGAAAAHFVQELAFLQGATAVLHQLDLPPGERPIGAQIVVAAAEGDRLARAAGSMSDAMALVRDAGVATGAVLDVMVAATRHSVLEAP